MSSRLLSFLFFFFNDTATTEIYTLSLHDALPISLGTMNNLAFTLFDLGDLVKARELDEQVLAALRRQLGERSEEHTSELQSRRDLVCRLLLEKKKKTIYSTNKHLSYHIQFHT